MATGDKIVNLDDLKVAYDALNASKLDKDFSSLDTSGGFSLSDTIPVNISGTTYKITGQTLSNAIGGGGGSQQASLTNYVKNCGTISVLPVTLTDSNITSDMIVIEYTIGDETALGSDWTVTTADGSLTISGTLNKSTTLQLVLSVGYSTTPSILTNLASDSADNILKASPRPGVTGVLPLLHGGVGSSTASGARTNLSVYSKAETDSAIEQSTAVETNITNWNDFRPESASIATFRVGRSISGNATNAPISGSNATWYGMIYGTNSYCMQMLVCVYANVSWLRGRIFTRSCVNGTWDIWHSIQSSVAGVVSSWLQNGTDLNDIIYPGTYGLTGSSTYPNRPSAVQGGILTVVSPTVNGTYCIQRIDTGAFVFIRYRSASSGTEFNSWYKYTGTAVI